MALALKLFITILIELPIIALLFNRKKRKQAVLMGALINIISWSVYHIIFFSFDISMLYVAIGLAVCEAVAFHYLLPCNWLKAFIISVIVNSLSYVAIQRYTVLANNYQPKQEIITTYSTHP